MKMNMPVPFRQWAGADLVEVTGYTSVALLYKDGETSLCFWSVKITCLLHVTVNLKRFQPHRAYVERDPTALV